MTLWTYKHAQSNGNDLRQTTQLLAENLEYGQCIFPPLQILTFISIATYRNFPSQNTSSCPDLQLSENIKNPLHVHSDHYVEKVRGFTRMRVTNGVKTESVGANLVPRPICL